jgi:hypothetical protein
VAESFAGVLLLLGRPAARVLKTRSASSIRKTPAQKSQSNGGETIGKLWEVAQATKKEGLHEKRDALITDGRAGFRDRRMGTE